MSSSARESMNVEPSDPGPSGFKIDYQLKLSWLFDWQVSGPLKILSM